MPDQHPSEGQSSKTTSSYHCCICIASFLLLILAEMLGSLVLSDGRFFHSEMPPVTGTAAYVVAAVHFCLLTPLVFLSFACLSLLLAAYHRDRAAVGLSVVLQAMSLLLILIGLVGYLFLNQSYLSWEHVLPWYNFYMGVEVELAVSIFLSQVTRWMILPF